MKIENSNNIDNASITRQPESKFDQVLSFLTFDLFNFKKKNIAVLKLSGVIGQVGPNRGMTFDNLNSNIEKAFNTPKLECVCLNINSPGGYPVQAEMIAKRIMSLSKEKNIPVYSFIEDMAASGGYVLALAGEKIFASRSSIIGNIGVIKRGFGAHELLKKLGVERRVYTLGKNKSILDPFMPEKPEDIKMIHKIQKHIYDHFVDFVKTRRGGKLTQTDEILFNGEIWAGETAKLYGIIDEIGSLYEFIKSNFQSDVNIRHISQKQGFVKKIFSMSNEQINSDEIIDKVFDKLEEKLITSKFDFK